MILLKITVYFQDWDGNLIQNVGKIQSHYTASYKKMVKWDYHNSEIILSNAECFLKINFSGIWWVSGSQTKDFCAYIFKGSEPMKKSQWLPLKMKAWQSFETSGTTRAATRYHIWEELNTKSHHSEDLKSSKALWLPLVTRPPYLQTLWQIKEYI